MYETEFRLIGATLAGSAMLLVGVPDNPPVNLTSVFALMDAPKPCTTPFAPARVLVESTRSLKA